MSLESTVPKQTIRQWVLGKSHALDANEPLPNMLVYHSCFTNPLLLPVTPYSPTSSVVAGATAVPQAWVPDACWAGARAHAAVTVHRIILSWWILSMIGLLICSTSHGSTYAHIACHSRDTKHIRNR